MISLPDTKSWSEKSGALVCGIDTEKRLEDERGPRGELGERGLHTFLEVRLRVGFGGFDVESS